MTTIILDNESMSVCQPQKTEMTLYHLCNQICRLFQCPISTKLHLCIANITKLAKNYQPPKTKKQVHPPIHSNE